MRILLTGATGLLGSAITAAAQEREFTCTPLARLPLATAGADELAGRLRGYDLLIHAGANTDVEQCEVFPEVCYRDNFLLSEMIAQATRLAGVPLAFISSTGVYGASKSDPHCEYDPVAPTTHHHASKVMAENAVLRLSGENFVVRTGWLFGGRADNPKNFVARRIEEARRAESAGGVISSNTEQRGNPCSSVDVARRLLDLAEARVSGIFNCVNSGSASRFEYVEAIVAASGIAVQVQPATAQAFGRKAKVSPNEMADNWKMNSMGWTALPDWRDSLASYIKALEAQHG